MTAPQLFVVTLRPARDVDPVIALRRLLRYALRACGMRCVAITTALGSDALVPEPGAEQRVASRGSVHDQ